MTTYNLIATTTFGLEAIAKREAEKLGFSNITLTDGKMHFTGTIEDIAKANIWLRTADRVLINIGEFEALTFDELFEKTKALPWGDFITEKGKFTVIGKSVRSKLFSVSDCQAIVKKAVVEKLKQKYKIDWFEETGESYEVQVAFLKDKATLTIDTSGPGLHKRGYRSTSMGAPIKETLAAALVQLSYYNKDKTLLDPLCGSGTIPIEAALIAKNIAPGLNRSFVSEEWDMIPNSVWKKVRMEAYSAIDTDAQPKIFGSDIDEEAIKIARFNAEKAGVDDCVQFEVKSIEDVTLEDDYGVLICNPPYGVRLGTLKEAEDLYKVMGKVFNTNDTWSVYVITSHESFEKLYGKKANAKRKLFSGMLKTDYYQFYGKKPAKKKFEPDSK